MCYNSLYLFDDILVNYFLLNHFDFVNFWDLSYYFNHFFNHLRHNYRSFFHLNNGNRYLMSDFSDLRYFLDMVYYFFHYLDIRYFHNHFLIYFHLHLTRDFYFLLHYLLYCNLNLYWFLYYYLLWHNFLFNNFNLFQFDLRNVDDPLHHDWFFDLNDFLLDSYERLHIFWNLYNFFDDLLSKFGHFDNHFDCICHYNWFLTLEINLFDNLSWDMYYFLKLNNFRVLDNLLSHSLDCNNLWDFDDPIHYFLNYFLNFDYLRNHPKHF